MTVMGKKVWAGAVTGGLWYNNDISSTDSSWKSVSEIWPNLTVTCIAFDPNDNDIIYVGTGEGFGSTFSSSRGYGIFKSTDGGSTWAHIQSTGDFYYINDLVVRNENGNSGYLCCNGYFVLWRTMERITVKYWIDGAAPTVEAHLPM